MDKDLHPKKAFIVHAVTVVHTCHSHNIAACRKRLETAARIFLSTCKFDALFDSLINECLSEIVGKLSQLRYVDSSEEAEIVRIKSDCLIVVRRLNEIVQRIETREDFTQPVGQPAQDTRSTAFGWMRATG